MHFTASSCGMSSMLQAGTLPARMRSALKPAPASVQPLVVLNQNRPSPPRNTGRGGRQASRQQQQQQQPSRPAAPPRAYQTSSSRSSSSRNDGSQFFQAARGAADQFVCRHDPFAVGFGCLLVTGYCVVAHGQDVWEALRLAGFSTILGMVSAGYRGSSISGGAGM
jgi:hypothetical protein